MNEGIIMLAILAIIILAGTYWTIWDTRNEIVTGINEILKELRKKLDERKEETE